MAERKAFPLRLSAEVYEALRHWADDELRSVNGQVEYLLRDALLRAGRLGPVRPTPVPADDVEHGS